MWKILSAHLLVMLLVSCATAPAPESVSVAPESTPVTILRDRQDISVNRSDTRLTIDNPHGNVYLRQSDEPFIGVFTTEQRLGATPEAARIRIDQEPRQIHVSIHYDSDAIIGVNTLIEGQLKGRVDLVVFVPPWLHCSLSTTYGDINIKRLENSITASAQSGSISATTRGQMNLETNQGDIHGSTMQADWTGTSTVTTQSGHIVFGVPIFGDVMVSARSRGSVLADFESTQSSVEGRHVVQHISGDGTRHLRLESVSGEIRLDGFDRDEAEISQHRGEP